MINTDWLRRISDWKIISGSSPSAFLHFKKSGSIHYARGANGKTESVAANARSCRHDKMLGGELFGFKVWAGPVSVRARKLATLGQH